jgi:predicted nucleotidyltransferase
MKYLKYLFSKYFSPKIPTENYIIPELSHLCTLFGSRLWGGYTKDSDVDLVAYEKDVDFILNTLDSMDIPYKASKETYTGVVTTITFYANNLKYSISLVQEKDNFNAYLVAIPITTKYFKENPSHAYDKKIRKTVFMSVFDLVRYNYNYLSTDLQKFLQTNYPELLI